MKKGIYVMTKKEKEEKKVEFAMAAMTAMIQGQWIGNSLMSNKEKQVFNTPEAISAWSWEHANAMIDSMTE